MGKLKFRVKAVIFDMDGVIVDSMPYHYLAWYEALRPYGVRVTCFDIYSKEGERWQKSLEDFFRRAHIHPDKKIIKKIFIERQKIFKRYFKRLIFKGVKEFLRCLKGQGYVLGLVTGTPTSEVKKIIPKNIRDLFSSIVGGDNVDKGKPYPDPYLQAARALKVGPKECLVIENAPYGIESAKRAGMFCIALATSLPKEYLAKADMVVNDLEEIAGIIDKSCRIK